MAKRISQEEARRYLCDVSPEKCFWVNSGQILKNIEELSSSLMVLGEDTFRYHVNAEKNDFSKWIDEVIGDKKLATSISNIRNKRAFIKKVDYRISQLKRALN